MLFCAGALGWMPWTYHTYPDISSSPPTKHTHICVASFWIGPNASSTFYQIKCTGPCSMCFTKSFSYDNFISCKLFQLFCYTRICWAIWENFNNKKMSSSAESGANGTGNGLNVGWRAFLARCRRIGRPTGQVSTFKLLKFTGFNFFLKIKAVCFFSIVSQFF